MLWFGKEESEAMPMLHLLLLEQLKVGSCLELCPTTDASALIVCRRSHRAERSIMMEQRILRFRIGAHLQAWEQAVADATAADCLALPAGDVEVIAQTLEQDTGLDDGREKDHL